MTNMIHPSVAPKKWIPERKKYKINDVIILTKNPYNWKNIKINKKYTIEEIYSQHYTLKDINIMYYYKYLEKISENVNYIRTKKLERILK